MRSTRGYDEDDDLTIVRSSLSHGTRRTAADDDYSEATSRHTQPRERRRRERRRSPSIRAMSSDSDTRSRSYTRRPARDPYHGDERDGKHDSIAYAILALGVFSMLAGVLRSRRDKRGNNPRDLRREEQARRQRQEDFERRKRERRRREDMDAERRYRNRDHDDQESVRELKTITYVPTEAPRSPSRGLRSLEPPPDDRDDRSRAPSRAGRSEAGSVDTHKTGPGERNENISRADSAYLSHDNLIEWARPCSTLRPDQISAPAGTPTSDSGPAMENLRCPVTGCTMTDRVDRLATSTYDIIATCPLSSEAEVPQFEGRVAGAQAYVAKLTNHIATVAQNVWPVHKLSTADDAVCSGHSLVSISPDQIEQATKATGLDNDNYRSLQRQRAKVWHAMARIDRMLNVLGSMIMEGRATTETEACINSTRRDEHVVAFRELQAMALQLREVASQVKQSISSL
ncbi:hypothetical protein LTR95_010922 [Oleoguttula sp. CCFEE 5521]